MLPLSLVLFGSHVTGSPGAGGAVLAGYSAMTVFAPARARLVDRRGAAVLAVFVAGNVGLLGALAALGAIVSAPAALVACAALAGACAPPLGPFTRAVAGAVLHGSPDVLQRTFALDSAAEEAALVVAPLVVALVTAAWTAAAAVLLAAGLILAGGLGTARSSLADHLPASARAGVDGPARVPPRAWLVIASLASIGAALGAVDVALPAIAGAAGAAPAAGLLLAAMAIGTTVAGLLTGLHAWRSPPLRRLALLQPAFALSLAACAPVHSLGALAVVLTVPGALLGILFVTAYVAMDALAPAGAATRTFAWLVTANNGGFALGAALAGALADESPHAALLLAAIAALPSTALAAIAATRRQAAR
jgi:hypothetical protein